MGNPPAVGIESGSSVDNMTPLWFFWGQKRMSFLRYMTLRSACDVHADVRIIVRDEELRPAVKWVESQDFMNNDDGADWMAEAMKLPIRVHDLREIAPVLSDLRAPDVQTSDLLAWWILATIGGTVCDMDIVFLKPLPEIIENVEVARWERDVHRYDYLPIGYIQGRPHDKWRDAYAKALAAYDPNVYQSCGGENLKPWPEARLSPFVVYPWAGAVYRQILDYCFKTTHWPPLPVACVGVHWYGGAWQSENARINGPDDLEAGAVSWAIKTVLAGSEVVVPR